MLKSLYEITSSFFCTLAKEHEIDMMTATHEMPSLSILKEQHFVIWKVIETEFDPLTVQSIDNKNPADLPTRGLELLVFYYYFLI